MITVTSYGRGAGSARVRVFDWIDHLGLDTQSHVYLGAASAGLSTTLRRPTDTIAAEIRLRALARHTHGETMLLSRAATPFSRGGIEARLLRSASRGVYDFDDALMHDDGRGLRGVFSKKAIWTASVRTAQHVIAGNTFLADAASRLNDHVSVIPSCVEPSHYQSKVFSEIDGPRSAVWLGSPATEHYLQEISGPLLSEHRRSGLRLRLISRGDADLGELAQMTDRITWSIDSFASAMIGGDFGIMPLEDTLWARGKCAYKLLQYSAAGLPTIGSPVGANADALGRTGGIQARTSDDWSDALRALVDASAEQLSRFGTAARQGVEQHYSFSRWQHEWLAAVRP